MNAGSSFAPLKLLMRDTFRQACASGIFWMMLAVTAICALFCLSVNVSGDTTLHADDESALFLPPPSPQVVAPSVVTVLASSNPLEAATLAGASSRKVWLALETNPDLARHEGIETISGQMTLGFGAMSVPVGRDKTESVHFLQLLLAEGVAGVLGLLLALVWTAGFAPAFLDPGAASVLLAKPVPRWQLLVGKYVGVLTFLAFQVVLFVAATWLALGVRTGVWDTTYWWAIPLLLLQFAVFYSFCLMLAVVTRSTAACIVGTVLFWLLAWGINYGSAMVRSLPDYQGLPPITHSLAEAAYIVSPKPIDAGLMLFNALDAQHHFEKPQLFQLLESGEGFSAELSILSSLAIVLALLALSAYEFNAKDY